MYTYINKKYRLYLDDVMDEDFVVTEGKYIK